MAITQVGYLGRTGPVFVDDSSVAGKFIILQGMIANGVVTYQAKIPAYASNLTGFPHTADQCVLGNYGANQVVVMSPAYKVPATGDAFDAYVNVANDWVAGTATANTVAAANTTTPTTTTNTTTPTGGTTTTTGGTTTTTDTTFKAPTISEQISTFLSNYWWLVALVIIALLYKPFIAPALGLSKKKRR